MVKNFKGQVYNISCTAGVMEVSTTFNSKGKIKKFIGHAAFVNADDFDFDVAFNIAVHEPGCILNKEEKVGKFSGMHPNGKKHNKVKGNNK